MAVAEKTLMKDLLVKLWRNDAAKLQTLAEAIPAAAWDEAPAAGVRTVGELVRHLVFWNRWTAAKARGESPDGSANEIPPGEAPSRAALLAALAASAAEAATALERRAREAGPGTVELYVSMLGHNAEHYGQLVVYARLRGIVPPASRS